MHSATRLWFATPRHLARQVGGVAGFSSSLARLHGSGGRRGDDGGCGDIRAEPVCRIKWIRRHVTFSHTAYAASYTARSAMLQATPQATPWRRFDKTGHEYAGRRILTDRAREFRNEISVACNAIMSVQYVILYYIVGPTCRRPNGHVRASLEI